MKMRSDLCLEHWLLSDLCKQKSHIIIRINGKINVCKCKRIFLIYTLQQKIEITDFKKKKLAGENTSVLKCFATIINLTHHELDRCDITIYNDNCHGAHSGDERGTRRRGCNSK